MFAKILLMASIPLNPDKSLKNLPLQNNMLFKIYLFLPTKINQFNLFHHFVRETVVH